MNEEAAKLDNVNEDLQNINEEIDTGAEDVSAEEAPISEEPAIDYAELAARDAAELAKEFSELSDLKDICELENPIRYAALRDLGLSPAEAYLATTRVRKRDNRSHLHATRAISSSGNTVMTEGELAAARELFCGVSDSEIRSLYKRVAGR